MTNCMQKSAKTEQLTPLFAQAGEVGKLIAAFDWSATPIGAMETWSAGLKTALSILLSSRFPMQILWGSEFIQFYNDAYIPIAGNKHPKAIGQRAAECWQEVWDFAGPLLDKVMTTGEATWSEDQLLVLNRHGYPEECYFTFSYTPIRDRFGDIGGVFIAVTETTQKVVSERTERQLRAEIQAAKHRLETIVTSISDELIILDQNWKFTYINEQTCTALGRSNNELIGQCIWELFPELTNTEFAYQLNQASEHQTVTWFDYFCPVRDRWLQNRVYPFSDGLSLLCVDITERKRIEGELHQTYVELEQRVQERTQALAEANVLLQSEVADRKRTEEILRNIAEGVSTTTGEPFFHSLVKYLARELDVDYALVGALESETAQRVQTIALYADGCMGENFEYDLADTPCGYVARKQVCCYPDSVQHFFPKDQSLADMAVKSYVGSPLVDSTGYVIGLMVIMSRQPLSKPEIALSVLQILASRATAELERRRAEQKIREQAALLDVATDAIFVIDLADCILFWNRSAERLYGWTAAESLGQKATERLYAGSTMRLETIQTVLVEQGEWRGELSHLTKSGREIIVASRWTLVRDETHQPKSILIVNTDITEQKQLEQQFLRAKRLESVGTLASGIAHDLNNILNPILGTVQLMSRRSFNPKDAQQFLEIIERNAKRGTELVKQILTFTRGEGGKQEIVQVRQVLQEIQQTLQPVFPKSIAILISIPEDLWTVSADVTQLHQIIMNLCVNARDAMPSGGTLTVTAHNRAIDAQFARHHLEAQVGSYVEIAVSDTGVGIPPEVLDRMFEPFFTTKNSHEGTGLGLSTVIGILKRYGGFVLVDSRVGEGSQFRVFLPALSP